MPEPIVLIVSGNASVRQSLKELFESKGLHATVFSTLQALLDSATLESRGCLVFQPENDTLDDPAQQERLAAACACARGVLITERGNVSMAVQALKAGIRDVVQKPYRDRDLLECIEKVLENNATA